VRALERSLAAMQAAPPSGAVAGLQGPGWGGYTSGAWAPKQAQATATYGTAAGQEGGQGAGEGTGQGVGQMVLGLLGLGGPQSAQTMAVSAAAPSLAGAAWGAYAAARAAPVPAASWAPQG
jgi:hypothetical protein